jgi:hypothetical protein
VLCEYEIEGRYPDWCIFNEGKLKCVIELTNFHADRASENEIKERLARGKPWCGRQSDRTERLYQALWRKCSIYKHIMQKLECAYVLALYADFFAPVGHQDIRECVLNDETGLFQKYPRVSGLVYFADGAGYRFFYLKSPHAVSSIDLPTGRF